MENLKDVTFLIPIRVDSEERLENLLLSITHLLHYFDTNILVFEADVTSRIDKENLPASVRYIFEEDADPIFYRTRILNTMTGMVDTPIIVIWDADVLVSPTQIQSCVEQLRTGNAQVAFPYNGVFLDVPVELRNEYALSRDFSILKNNIPRTYALYGKTMVGGAIFVNRDAYIEAGMENEHFYGWGNEDSERVKRWEILGYTIFRARGPLFHLTHPRGINSGYASQDAVKKSLQEIVRLCKLTKEELLCEIKNRNQFLTLT